MPYLLPDEAAPFLKDFFSRSGLVESGERRCPIPVAYVDQAIAEAEDAIDRLRRLVEFLEVIRNAYAGQLSNREPPRAP